MRQSNTKMNKNIKQYIHDKNNIEQLIHDIIDKNIKEAKETTRYKSWEYCYKFFQDNHTKIKSSKEKMQLAELHLGFYLASWGMYRGSSFLLDYDYTIHKKAIKCLCNSTLWNTNFDTLLNSEHEFNEFKKFKREFNKLIQQLNKAYEDEYNTWRGHKKLKNNQNTILTDTLITKIILGTLGITPAYDRFFKYGIKWLKDQKGINAIFKEIIDAKFKKTINAEFKKTINAEEITKFYIFYNKFFQQCTKNKTHKYPPMKLIDMFLWQKGFEEEQQNNKKKQINNYNKAF